MSIALISEYLETYSGRDKFLRALSYMAKLATVATSSKEIETKLKIFGSQMSGCRVILRLLDDIPTLHYAITYGWGKREPDWLTRWVELMQIIVDIIYCPIEHISWAGEKKILLINTEAWDTATTWFWIVSLHLSLIKTLRKLKQLENYRTQLSVKYDKNPAMQVVRMQQRNKIWTCVRLLLDVSYAVSYLPPGVLWGGRLKTWQVGALGTVSSLIGLYQALNEHAKQKKHSY